MASARLPFPPFLEFIDIFVDAMMGVGRDFLVLFLLVAVDVDVAVLVVAAAVAVVVAAAAAAAVAIGWGAFCLRHGGGVWMKRDCWKLCGNECGVFGE